MPSNVTDRAVAAIATSQHGLVTYEQAINLGMSPKAVQHRLDTGRWSRVHRGVYRIQGYPSTQHQALAAACLLGGPGSAVSHRAAAPFHGVRLPGDVPIEVSVPRSRAPRTAGIVAHRSRDLDADQIVRIDGLPVTGPVRLLVDLGQVVPWWLVDRALEHLLSRKAVTVPQVRAGLAHHSRRGRNGCGALRHVLERRGLVDLAPEGVTESLLAQVCRDHDLPLPEHQHEVVVGGRRYRIDFAYVDRRVAIEVDGYEFHAGPEQFELDRARGNDLVLTGWTLLRFTFQQLVHRPTWVAAQLARVLRIQAPGAAA
jgi:very-short-patch-repair endonuclease